MIELSVQFWCEFVASVAVALLVFAGFALILRRRENHFGGNFALPEKRDAADKGAADAVGGALDFLREAVRLAEEMVRTQGEQARALERKAVLLGALCLFTVAFLLTGEFNSPGALPVKFAAIALLVIAAAFCAQTIDFFHCGSVGLYAPDMDEYVRTPRPGDFAYLSGVALENYKARIEINEETNLDKVRVLIRAKQWWVCGASAALGALAGNSILVQSASGWLTG